MWNMMWNEPVIIWREAFVEMRNDAIYQSGIYNKLHTELFWQMNILWGLRVILNEEIIDDVEREKHL